METFSEMLFVAILASSLMCSEFKLIHIPETTTSVVGGDAKFKCSSTFLEVNWNHRPVGKIKHADVYKTDLGLRNGYAARYSLNIDKSIGQYDLVISDVRPSDAGTFFCVDNGGIGENSSAELIVIDSYPSCSSNISSDGALGDNICNLEPDYIGFFCSVNYQGNIAPQLQWRNVSSGDVITNSVTQQTTSRSATYILSLKTELNINRTSFICQVQGLESSKNSCSTPTFKVLYLLDNFETMKASELQNPVTCLANTSQQCEYKWRIGRTVINGPVLRLTDQSISDHSSFLCIAECNIHGKICPVDVLLVQSTNYNDGNLKTTIGIVTATVVCVIFLTMILSLLFRRNIQKCLKVVCNKTINNPDVKSNETECVPLMLAADTEKVPEDANKVLENKSVRAGRFDFLI